MCCDLPSTRADMTFPSADRDRLILVASLSRSPVACVFDCLSLPARSTRFNFPTVICSPVRTVPVESQHSTMIVKIACDLEEPAFMAVAPTDRFFLPACMTWSISCEDFTCAARRGLSTRSERPQNHKRDHPLPSFLQTTRVDGVKASLHNRTPRSDDERRQIFYIHTTVDVLLEVQPVLRVLREQVADLLVVDFEVRRSH